MGGGEGKFREDEVPPFVPETITKLSLFGKEDVALEDV